MSGIGELEKRGNLKIETIDLGRYTAEGVLLHLQGLLEKVHPTRVVLDDVTALEAMTDEDEFYHVLSVMTQLAKKGGATVVISIPTDELVGTLITGKSFSAILDGI